MINLCSSTSFYSKLKYCKLLIMVWSILNLEKVSVNSVNIGLVHRIRSVNLNHLEIFYV
jgi:hypothetical protein